ncbi:hypothetical protein D9619_013124 [Psilocybe cf. subviscida]|uniref:Glucose-methanol-choline oxidoreductase C-terminal domain-containing protein n=1 Tax=Psilocybe cf. subviscida TaxID=2480587 RepID=A0A8H5EVL6_9AGAR|nr:hypothetical protein D9619_013124 [Psilocybe cf. subviscida]
MNNLIFPIGPPPSMFLVYNQHDCDQSSGNETQHINFGCDRDWMLATTCKRTYGTSLGEELNPGPDIQLDEQLDTWLFNRAGIHYHPTGSCSMLPKNSGGVVDASMRMYGLANVHAVDSSVFPFEFAAHLASATYGVVEQAAILSA